MKIVTFNIRYANDGDGHSIAERAPRLKAALDRYDADIVGFQEAVPEWMDFINSEFSGEYEIYNVYRAQHNLEGTPVMWKKSRFDCIDKGRFWLSDTPEEESLGWDTIGCYRIALWVKLKDKVSGGELLYINTHYGFGDDCQTASGRLIIDYVKKLHAERAVLTVDFNMTADSAGYSVLSKYFDDVNMKTVCDEGDTYHAYLNNKGSRIDFCFVTPNIKSVDSHRMTEEYGGKFPSDHYGVCSDIEI